MSSTCVLYHEGALHLPMICPLQSWLSLLVGEILKCTTPGGLCVHMMNASTLEICQWESKPTQDVLPWQTNIPQTA